MGSTSLTGNDVAIINGSILTDVADGDFATLSFDTDIANMKVSKDGNTIYALNQQGNVVKCTLRLLLGSGSDSTLNSLLQSMLSNFAGFTLLTGSFTKRVGDGAGNVSDVVYQLSNGIFKKWPGAKSNAEGDVEQSVAVFEIDFLNQGRSIQ